MLVLRVLFLFVKQNNISLSRLLNSRKFLNKLVLSSIVIWVAAKLKIFGETQRSFSHWSWKSFWWQCQLSQVLHVKVGIVHFITCYVWHLKLDVVLLESQNLTFANGKHPQMGLRKQRDMQRRGGGHEGIGGDKRKEANWSDFLNCNCQCDSGQSVFCYKIFEQRTTNTAISNCQ